MDSASEDFDKFKQKYILTSVVLGKGGFGQVFLGRTTTTGMNVAIKIATSSELESEYKIYEALVDFNVHDAPIPSIYGFGRIGEFSYLAMDLLGPSIDSLEKKMGKFTRDTILLVAYQMVDCLAYLHSKGIVHCDVKADNFAISASNDQKIILFDFGLALKEGTQPKSFRGSLGYASIRAHASLPLRRVDDLESLGYVLSDFVDPLPWIKDIRLWKNDLSSLVDHVRWHKHRISYIQLSHNFTELRCYLRHLILNNEPDYGVLKEIFVKDVIGKKLKFN